MKKIIALLIFVCAGTALFGQSVRLSVGGGGFFNANFSSYTLNKEYTEDAYKDILKASYFNNTLIGGGIYGFFDATYVEANLGLLFGNVKNDQYPSGLDGDAKDQTKGWDVTALKIGIFGKYPFQLGERVSVFPMLGLDIMVPLGGKMGGKDINDKDGLKDVYSDIVGSYLYGEDAKDASSAFRDQLTQIYFKLGGGLDILATDHIFIRPEFMWGIRLPTAYENSKLIGKYDDEDFEKSKLMSGVFGHGLDVRVAVGYKF